MARMPSRMKPVKLSVRYQSVDIKAIKAPVKTAVSLTVIGMLIVITRVFHLWGRGETRLKHFLLLCICFYSTHSNCKQFFNLSEQYLFTPNTNFNSSLKPIHAIKNRRVCYIGIFLSVITGNIMLGLLFTSNEISVYLPSL